ncbi:MAG: hypothetical protein KQI62_03250 [Deltaproteobacteria bacterium]|nr:hypothetical protein [Deltaproteobacteria bacterium]
MGEKFSAAQVTGTATITVPIFSSPGRSGFGPELSLSYDSGAGNGPFGMGWHLGLPQIARRTDKGLPIYCDAEESDVFTLSGHEDLVPALKRHDDGWRRERLIRNQAGRRFRVQPYRLRREGLFARIERWTDTDSEEIHWRSISPDNITSIYGDTPGSRIADPVDPSRVYRWMISTSYDDKGNAIVYEYEAENSAGIDLSEVHEQNRSNLDRTANRYLKRIKYGNRTSRLVQPDLSAMRWMFEVVFDYGQGHLEELSAGDDGQHTARASVHETRQWPARRDPFSSYRAGFEVRTYRLCRRVLMFHHLPEELGTDDCLVRSTSFSYRQDAVASFMTGVEQSGYVRQADGSYLGQSLPPLEFGYSQAGLDRTVRKADADSLADPRRHWVDLNGEGLSGILSQEGGGWFYRPNRSPLSSQHEAGEEPAGPLFGPAVLLSGQPASVMLGTGQAQFMDLAGDGRLDVVIPTGPGPGFYERSPERGWDRFVPFESFPNLNWDDPNLTLVDLTGDGHSDILLTGDHAFTWYPSLAERGFGEASRSIQPFDEDQGPRLVLADGTQTVHLADMSGDGLSDLVRIRNGEVCYWPNLGYGRFGPKVTMDNSPWFDEQDQFEQTRLHLADIDGCGVVDLVYQGKNGVQLYLNESGNSWRKGDLIEDFPHPGGRSSLAVLDLLGNGTACLVWSSALPADRDAPLRYLELTGGVKPHLLVSLVNNLGGETRFSYAPSTRFYLEDQAAGKPWKTRLPFPVQVVERIETLDRILNHRFVKRYAYHHGYFDGEEREFRGFGMVEEWDTEEYAWLAGAGDGDTAANLDQASFVPPTLTRTWFHTGAYLQGAAVSRHFETEYYREPGLGGPEFQAQLLPDTILPPGLSTGEMREAYRALKSSLLRKEVYALDGSAQSPHPYEVSESNATVKLLQPRAENRHAVFFAHPLEIIHYNYERKPADPRISHELVLQVDRFGNIRKSATVSYGRRTADPALAPEERMPQMQTRITLNENRFTNAVRTDDAYRNPLPYEALAAELSGLELPPDTLRFSARDIQSAWDAAEAIPYEAEPTDGRLQMRLTQQVRKKYRSDDLSGPLPWGSLDSRALPYESYSLAFTPGLLARAYEDRVSDEMLLEGGYVQCGDDPGWWAPSGQIFYAPETVDTGTPELNFAREHFFLPHRSVDPFGQTQGTVFDPYCLLVQDTWDPAQNRISAGERDAAGNLTTNGNDYRVLAPKLVMDPNRNVTEVAFCALGMTVGMANRGKPEESQGDSLAGFEPDLPQSVVLEHIAHPLRDGASILGRATKRTVYDLFAYRRSRGQSDPQPVTAYTLARETHDADLGPGQSSRLMHSFSYSNGAGNVIHHKNRGEPGPLSPGGPIEAVRWIGSGWTVLNNKGLPVRQYEPFFSASHEFQPVQTGAASTLFYDPLGRSIGVLHADHSYEKTVFDAWEQETWDANDTVLQADSATDPHLCGYFQRLAEDEYLPTWHAQRMDGGLGPNEQAAAQKAAVHANTPTRTFFNSQGQGYLSQTHNHYEADAGAVEQRCTVRTRMDIQGNVLEVIDARKRSAMRYSYSLGGAAIRIQSQDAGTRWMLPDLGGNPVYQWSSRGHVIRTVYDTLRRPLEIWVQGAEGPPRLVRRTVYGESRADPEALNLRGKAYEVFDPAGLVTNESFDFKGNVLRSTRRLALNYRDLPDWSLPVSLEEEAYSISTAYDALDRPVRTASPDGTVLLAHYNEANLLERVEGNLRGAAEATTLVAKIDYDSKGQRTRLEYGNGASTGWEYDPLTFRPTRQHSAGSGAAALQDLNYTYDPVGNITHIHDAAQQTIFFRNRRIDPDTEYTYDALYRLIAAAGREHLGQSGSPGGLMPPTPNGPSDSRRCGLSHPADGNAMGRYLRRFAYDEAGNLLQISHSGLDPVHPGWSRAYAYNAESLLDPSLEGDRLSGTAVGEDSGSYSYDRHGNMTAMPHLPLMQWNHWDHLQATARQARDDGGRPETTYYVYDSAGQRVRKVTERQAGPGDQPTRKEERIYLPGLELHREYRADGERVRQEVQTLRLVDDQQHLALIETKTIESGVSLSDIRPFVRYQLGSHLGSTALELDSIGQVISYEEYYPYGGTSFQAGTAALAPIPKRYRYSGKERDAESGLYYHGARYYAPWLGRWTSCDPIWGNSGRSLYSYVNGNPVNATDPTGRCEARVLRSVETQAGNRTFYHVVDFQRYGFEFGTPSEGMSTVGDDMARIDVQGLRAGRGLYGEGVYAFRSEEGARAISATRVVSPRPYAAFRVAPNTMVTELTIQRATGEVVEYILINAQEGSHVQLVHLRFRNVSDLQRAAYVRMRLQLANGGSSGSSPPPAPETPGRGSGPPSAGAAEGRSARPPAASAAARSSSPPRPAAASRSATPPAGRAPSSEAPAASTRAPRPGARGGGGGGGEGVGVAITAALVIYLSYRARNARTSQERHEAQAGLVMLMSGPAGALAPLLMSEPVQRALRPVVEPAARAMAERAVEQGADAPPSSLLGRAVWFMERMGMPTSWSMGLF